MNVDFSFKAVLIVILAFLGLCPLKAQESEEPNAKAGRYHSLLLKKPGNTMVFGRFVDAWLDTGSKKGLTGWLESTAESGGAPDWQILGALHQYLGEDELALKALNEAVNLDGENAELRLSRAKMQARLLAFEAALIDLEVAAKDEKTAIEASKLKGLYLARAGQVDEAVEAWKEVIAAYPEDEELREDLIEVEVMEGLYKEAIEASSALVEMTKDPYKKTLRRLRLGDIQILGGDREAGLKTYEEIMAATGEGTWLEREVLAQVERVFLKEDDIKGLRDYYQKLREEYPRRVSIRKVLARQMALNDEMKEAIALFQEVLKITPGDLGNREEFIAFLEANEKWTEAREELGSLLEQREEDALLWERFSRVEAKLNNEEGVKAALAKVAALRKMNPEGLLAAAALYDQAKIADEAEALLREGRVAFPDSLEVAEGLASFLVQNKKEDEALEIWRTMAKGADREGLLRVARSLNSHGKGGEAFGILGKRIGDLENDPLILMQYCKLASSEEEAGAAIPQGLVLVNQATTPTELETAVQLALRLIARAGKKEEIQNALAEDEGLGVSGQCLLSAIYADQGDSLKAEEVLTKVAALPDGSLARFYRVRFEEERGNLEKAIEILRGIIETPEGRKTVHLRRLVDLLERSGDYEKALAAVDDWKRIAPGDHSAWKRRAKLLQANGQPEEAVVELRRMIGKFGADEERRAGLAAALIEAAEYTPAQRIYEQLYSESEKLESKLKWAGEMAQLAEREGKLEELLEDFDRRKRTNPRSVAPLLAIAEIHRVLDQYEERRSALLEASRRRPEDTQLLARIAEVEERAGEFDRAVGILRDAVKRDKTPESKRRLASLLLKNGEVQSGLDLLSEIPGTVNEARGLEGIVQALVSAQEMEYARSFLEKHLGKHETDWRLKYLQAMVFKLDGESEKALELFTSLLKGGDEIPGLKPLVGRNSVAQNMGPWSALFGANGWEELAPYQQYISQRNTGMPGQSGTARIALPGTPRELQLLSLLQGSTVLEGIPEKDLPAARKALSLPGVQDVDILASMMSGGRRDVVGMLQKRAEEEPDNVGLFALSLMYGGDSGGMSVEEFDKAEKVLLETHPEIFGMVAFAAMRSPEVTAGRMAGALEKALKNRPQDETGELLEMLSFYTFSPFASQNNGGKDMSPIKNLMAERALITTEVPKRWAWMPMVVSHLIAQKKTEEAVTLINRLCQWQEQAKGPPQAGGMMQMFSFGGRQSRNSYLKPPPFPPVALKGVPETFLQLFPVKAKKVNGEDDEEALLLARLQMGDEEADKVDLTKGFEERVDKISNPALRALAYLSLERDAEAQKLIEEMMNSREESSLLFAAGYFHDRDDPRVYEALLKVRMLPLSRDSRKKVDGHLAMIGSLFAGKDEVKIDLEPAKRAALRLRRVLSIEEREDLGKVLVKLGLKNEAERLAAVPKPVASAGAVFGGMSSGRQGDRIAELTKNGNIDGAAREAAKQFRLLVNGRDNDWELRELKERLSSKELKEETLQKLDPGESESSKRLFEFARAQQLFGTKEKAREIFEKILAKNPNHAEARVGAIQCTPFNEIDQDRVIIRKDEKIDVDATGQVFDSLWEAADSGEVLAQYVDLCKLTESFLNALPPSGEAERNLSWVPYHILDFATETYLANMQLESLVNGGNGFGGGQIESNSKATKMRNDAVGAVFRAMIKHPQIAEQGFMLLESGKKGLGLNDDDLVKLARSAMTQMIKKEENSNPFGENDLWSKYYANGSSSSGELSNAIGPMTWLMTYAAKTNTEMLTPELIEKLKKAQPEKFALLDQARALGKAEGAEAEKIYGAWKDELPARKREKAVAFAKQVLLFSPKPGPWADDLEKLILDGQGSSSGFGFGSGDRSWGKLIADWGAWRLRTVGEAKYQEFLLSLFEDSFGPSDKWEVLAKLGEDSLPQKYQQAGYGFQRISSALLGNAELVKPTLLFLARHPLEDFVYDLDDAIEEAWSPRYTSTDYALKRIQENRLLVLDEDNTKPTPQHFLMVADGVTKIKFSNGMEAKQALGDAILKAKDLNPLLQNVAAASLLGSSKGRALIEPLFEKDVEFVKSVVTAEPERAFEILRRWFPKMENSKVSAPLQEVFASFATEARTKKVAMMQGWLKDGVPGIADKEADEFWEEFIQLISLDEQLANQVAVRILSDVRVAKSSSRYSSNGITRQLHDRWLSSLMSLIQSRSTELDLPQQVRLIDSIYRSEVGGFLLEPMVAGRYNQGWLWQMFEEVVKAGDLETTALPWLEELDEGQQATLAMLVADGALVAKSEVLDKLKEHKELLRENAPAFAGLLEMVTHFHNSRDAKDEVPLEKARLVYLGLLRNFEIPVTLRVDLLARVNRRGRVLHFDGEVLKEVTKLMVEYGKTERTVAASAFNEIVTGLVDVNFPGFEEVAGPLAAEAEKLLLSADALAMRNRGSLPEVNKAIIKIALKAGDAKLASKLLRKNYAAYRGNLEVMASLTRAGEIETVRKLVAAKTEAYDESSLGFYDQDFHSLSLRILEAIPEGNRYHLEVVLSNLPDPEEGKGSPYDMPRNQRIEKLARGFEERGGDLKGDARLQVLAAFGGHNASALLVEKQLREVYDGMSIANSFDFEDRSDRLKRSFGFEVIKRVVHMDISAGNPAPVEKKVREFVEAVDGGANSSWQLRQQIGPVFGLIGHELIVLAAQNPADAEKAIPMAKAFYDLAIKVKGDRSPVNTLDGAALIVHALAGKDQDWKAYLETHPDKDRYDEVKNNRGRRDLFEELVTDSWRNPEMAEARAKVLRALLDSKLYRERDLNYIHDFYGLSDPGFFSVREVVDGVEALPDDHPLKAMAMFHSASLKAYKLKERNIEGGIAAYTKAMELARENGDPKLANQILAHRCDVLYRHDRKQEAKVDAALIILDDLPGRDKKWVSEALPKWLK